MPGALERGRECYAQRKWADAYDSLSRADQAMTLGGKDLDLLAMAAYLIGRDEDYLSTLERAHQAYLDAGEGLRSRGQSDHGQADRPNDVGREAVFERH